MLPGVTLILVATILVTFWSTLQWCNLLITPKALSLFVFSFFWQPAFLCFCDVFLALKCIFLPFLGKQNKNGNFVHFKHFKMNTSELSSDNNLQNVSCPFLKPFVPPKKSQRKCHRRIPEIKRMKNVLFEMFLWIFGRNFCMILQKVLFCAFIVVTISLCVCGHFWFSCPGGGRV